MSENNSDPYYDDRHVMTRRVMDYVKYKHKAKKSRQYYIMGSIFLAASTFGILFFVLLITGVIPANKDTSSVSIVKDNYGLTQDGRNVERFTIENTEGLKLQVITLGCTVISVQTKDTTGAVDDILLGFDNIEGYENEENVHFGAIGGRFVGSIDKETFLLDGHEYHVTTNGWEKIIWNATAEKDQVTFSHVSLGGDENFPGEIHIDVSFRLTENNEILTTYSAHILKKASPINLASHLYFNLGGKGAQNISDHQVTIYADRYLPLRSDRVPTGDILGVAGTIYDLREATNLSEKLKPLTESLQATGGYDDHFCLRGPTGKRLAATVLHPGSGRTMTVHTDQPAIRLNTGNMLDISGGKQGQTYLKHSGISLQTGDYPDAINHDNFPDCVLRPGSLYTHTVWYQFDVQQ